MSRTGTQHRKQDRDKDDSGMSNNSYTQPIQGVNRSENPFQGSLQGGQVPNNLQFQNGSSDVAFLQLFQSVAKEQKTTLSAQVTAHYDDTSAVEEAPETQPTSEKATKADKSKSLDASHAAHHTAHGEGDIRFHDKLSRSDIEWLMRVMGQPPGADGVNPAIQIPLQLSLNASANFAPSGTGNQGSSLLSGSMQSLVKQAYKTGQPVRIAMDEESAIILRIRQGKVSAEFVTSNPALALALPQQLDELRQRMLAKNLPVDTLSSRQDESNGQSKKNQSNDSHEENA